MTPQSALKPARELARLNGVRFPNETPEYRQARDALQKMVVADVDWALIREQQTAWMQQWDREIRGRNRRATPRWTRICQGHPLARHDCPVARRHGAACASRNERS